MLELKIRSSMPMKFRLTIVCLLILCIPTSIRADEEFLVYLPVIAKPFPPSPAWVEFETSFDNHRMRGLIVDEAFTDSLTGYWGDVYSPQGVYYILIMDVINCEPRDGYVSMIDTFWMRDTAGTLHPMSDLDEQGAAGWEFKRKIVYDNLQPLNVYGMVFVFDVPVRGSYDLVHRPWEHSIILSMEQ